MCRHLDADLFADPAYDILLDLFASGEEGRPVSMSSGAYAARVARTTALRWIRLLEKRGLIEFYADEADRRLTLIRLTASARTSLFLYLRQVAEERSQR
jgi:DNA-binding MarR family transcriptional regulator